MERSKEINRISIITIVINSILSAFKLVAGILSGSAAIISDSVHSFSDVFSTIIVIIGVNLSKKSPDRDHNFGHEKIESIASLCLAAVLFATAVGIIVSGATNIAEIINGAVVTPPTILAVIAALVSIGTKEWMYHYTKRAAKKTDSTALMADAWHHRSDAFSSIGSLIGAGGAMLGLYILDPIASIVIGALIVKVSFDIAKTAVGQLTDRAADPETYERIKEIIESVDGVAHMDSMQTRLHVNQLCLDVKISIPKDLTIEEGHTISHNVKMAIQKEFTNIKSCIIHVNPD